MPAIEGIAPAFLRQRMPQLCGGPSRARWLRMHKGFIRVFGRSERVVLFVEEPAFGCLNKLRDIGPALPVATRNNFSVVSTCRGMSKRAFRTRAPFNECEDQI